MAYKPTVVVLAALALLLAACGADSETSPDDEVTTSTSSTSAPTTTSNPPDGTDDPDAATGDEPAGEESAVGVCAVLTTEEVATLLGGEVSEGELSETSVDASGDGFAAVYDAATCTWVGSANGTELRVQVSTAADFEGGALVCTAGSGLQDEVVSGVGNEATWSYNDPRAKGELVACSGTAVVSVEIEGLGADGLQDKAIGVTQRYLEAF